MRGVPPGRVPIPTFDVTQRDVILPVVVFMVFIETDPVVNDVETYAFPGTQRLVPEGFVVPIPRNEF